MKSSRLSTVLVALLVCYSAAQAVVLVNVKRENALLRQQNSALFTSYAGKLRETAINNLPASTTFVLPVAPETTVDAGGPFSF